MAAIAVPAMLSARKLSVVRNNVVNCVSNFINFCFLGLMLVKLPCLTN